MSDDDRRLYLESIAEMKELKGEISEFKVHVMGRIKRLECNEGKRTKELLTAISVVIAGLALLVNCFVQFLA